MFFTKLVVSCFCLGYFLFVSTILANCYCDNVDMFSFQSWFSTTCLFFSLSKLFDLDIDDFLSFPFETSKVSEAPSASATQGLQNQCGAQILRSCRLREKRFNSFWKWVLSG